MSNYNPLIENAATTCETIISLLTSKNGDYGKEDDVLSNFRACSRFGIPVELGIMVRFSDKVSRIENFIKGGKPNNESLDDSIIDAIGYLLILRYALSLGQPEVEPKVAMDFDEWRKTCFPGKDTEDATAQGL